MTYWAKAASRIVSARGHRLCSTLTGAVRDCTAVGAILRWGARAIWPGMANQLAKNRSRAGLWLPVAFGAGIFGYFELRFEPPFWGGPVMCGLLILLLLFTRRSLMCVFCLIPVLMASAGFSAAQFRTLQVSAPVLKREIAASLTGIVEEVRVTSRGERAVVRVEQLGRLAPEDRPDRVRLLVLKRDRMPSAGSRITVFGRFRPPPPPVAPYAYDFQRALFFNGIGAVGFALGSVTVTERRSCGCLAPLDPAQCVIRENSLPTSRRYRSARRGSSCR